MPSGLPQGKDFTIVVIPEKASITVRQCVCVSDSNATEIHTQET